MRFTGFRYDRQPPFCSESVCVVVYFTDSPSSFPSSAPSLAPTVKESSEPTPNLTGSPTTSSSTPGYVPIMGMIMFVVSTTTIKKIWELPPYAPSRRMRGPDDVFFYYFLFFWPLFNFIIDFFNYFFSFLPSIYLYSFPRRARRRKDFFVFHCFRHCFLFFSNLTNHRISIPTSHVRFKFYFLPLLSLSSKIVLKLIIQKILVQINVYIYMQHKPTISRRSSSKKYEFTISD